MRPLPLSFDYVHQWAFTTLTQVQYGTQWATTHIAVLRIPSIAH